MEFITVKPPCGRNIVILFQPPNSRKSKILTMDLADMCFVEYVGGEKFEKETPKCSMKLEEFRRRSLPKSHEAKKKKLPLAILHMTCFGMMLNVTLKNLRFFNSGDFSITFYPMEFIAMNFTNSWGMIMFFTFVPTTFFCKSKSWIQGPHGFLYPFSSYSVVFSTGGFVKPPAFRTLSLAFGTLGFAWHKVVGKNT